MVMTSSVTMSRVLFFTLVTVAAVGGAGIDRWAVSTRAEVVCPIAAPIHEAPIPKQPYLPIPSGRSW